VPSRNAINRTRLSQLAELSVVVCVSNAIVTSPSQAQPAAQAVSQHVFGCGGHDGWAQPAVEPRLGCAWLRKKIHDETRRTNIGRRTLAQSSFAALLLDGFAFRQPSKASSGCMTQTAFVSLSSAAAAPDPSGLKAQQLQGILKGVPALPFDMQQQSQGTFPPGAAALDLQQLLQQLQSNSPKHDAGGRAPETAPAAADGDAATAAPTRSAAPATRGGRTSGETRPASSYNQRHQQVSQYTRNAAASTSCAWPGSALSVRCTARSNPVLLSNLPAGLPGRLFGRVESSARH
jgi:hypothetical protein